MEGQQIDEGYPKNEAMEVRESLENHLNTTTTERCNRYSPNSTSNMYRNSSNDRNNVADDDIFSKEHAGQKQIRETCTIDFVEPVTNYSKSDAERFDSRIEIAVPKIGIHKCHNYNGSTIKETATGTRIGTGTGPGIANINTAKEKDEDLSSKNNDLEHKVCVDTLPKELKASTKKRGFRKSNSFDIYTRKEKENSEPDFFNSHDLVVAIQKDPVLTKSGGDEPRSSRKILRRSHSYNINNVHSRSNDVDNSNNLNDGLIAKITSIQSPPKFGFKSEKKSEDLKSESRDVDREMAVVENEIFKNLHTFSNDHMRGIGEVSSSLKKKCPMSVGSFNTRSFDSYNNGFMCDISIAVDLDPILPEDNEGKLKARTTFLRDHEIVMSEEQGEMCSIEKFYINRLSWIVFLCGVIFSVILNSIPVFVIQRTSSQSFMIFTLGMVLELSKLQKSIEESMRTKTSITLSQTYITYVNGYNDIVRCADSTWYICLSFGLLHIGLCLTFCVVIFRFRKSPVVISRSQFFLIHYWVSVFILSVSSIILNGLYLGQMGALKSISYQETTTSDEQEKTMNMINLGIELTNALYALRQPIYVAEIFVLIGFTGLLSAPFSRMYMVYKSFNSTKPIMDCKYTYFYTFPLHFLVLCGLVAVITVHLYLEFQSPTPLWVLLSTTIAPLMLYLVLISYYTFLCRSLSSRYSDFYINWRTIFIMIVGATITICFNHFNRSMAYLVVQQFNTQFYVLAESIDMYFILFYMYGKRKDLATPSCSEEMPESKITEEGQRIEEQF
eukprot:Awhi_evm1s8211